MEQNYEKQKLALRYRLQGKGFYMALVAMDLAESLHTGTRKDGNPEFSHQISIASYAATLIDGVVNEEEIYCAIFLHDAMEDYDLSFEEIKAKTNNMVANAVLALSKVRRDVPKLNNEMYYSSMKGDFVATVAKGMDRVHNLMTMLGGFKPQKQMEYIKETKEYVLPMLKAARRRYPAYENIYENIKFVMTNQIRLYEALNKELV